MAISSARFRATPPAAARRRALRSGLVASSVLVVAACGGGSPPPHAPAPATAAKVGGEAPPDVSAVPTPEKLLVFARVNRPGQVVNAVGGWVGLPLPAADAVGEILSGETVGGAIDLDQPVDVAVAGDPRGHSPKPQWAMAAAVKSPSEAREILGKTFSMTGGKNGVVRLEEKGRPKGDDADDDEDERHCALYPAFVPGGGTGVRLVCSSTPGGLESLGPYLSRTAPRQAYPSDLHVDATLSPLRPLIQTGRTLLPAMAANMLGVKRAESAAIADLATAMIGDVVDFALDLDKLSVDAKVDEAAASATLVSSFQDSSSLLARLATSHPERADAPPQAFWRLPADTDTAFFHRGVDAKDLDHPRDLLLKVVDDALDKEGAPAADKKALDDALTHLASLLTSPGVVARGMDWAAIQKAMAAQRAAGTEPAPKPGAKPGAGTAATSPAAEAARTTAWSSLAGWAMAEVDQPAAQVGGAAKELAAAMSRPGVVKWLKSSTAAGAPPLSVKIAPASAKAGKLPNDTVHLTVTSVHVIDEGEHGAPRPVAPAAPGAAAGKGAAAATPTAGATAAAAASKPKLAKPVTLHLFIVPDNGHAWIAFGLDEALLGSRLRAVLGTAAASEPAGTIADREGLGDLRSAKPSSGGFLDSRSLFAGTPIGYVTMRMPQRTLNDPFRGLAATPSQGATAIPFTFLAQAPANGAKGGTFVMTTKVPKAAIVDLVAIAMHH